MKLILELMELPFEGGRFVTTRHPDMTSSVDWGSTHGSHTTTAQWVCTDAENNVIVAIVKDFGLKTVYTSPHSPKKLKLKIK